MKARRGRAFAPRKLGVRVVPTEFVFVDRKTGKKRFAVKPGRDGQLPLEATSSLLAIHCLLRSQRPADFRVMVAVRNNFMQRVAPRTRQLIEACSSELIPIRITIRQQQVLRGIFQSLRNKEIAAKMNVAERTVKFHVAALLEKFHVTTRLDLAEKVGELISTPVTTNGPVPKEFPAQRLRTAWPEAKPTLVGMACGERRASAKLPA